MEYIVSSSQSTTNTTNTRSDFTIAANGAYRSTSQSRASNQTIREAETGTFSISAGLIIKRSSSGREMKYQLVAFMIQPNGAALITLVYIGDGPQRSVEDLRAACGHAHGYITCVDDDEWVRLP